MIKYSIVVPLRNEEETVTDFYDRVKSVMEEQDELFELVLVDDGSTDRTFPLLKEIAKVDSRVVVVKLRRNFGQSEALAAGLDNAQGEYVVAMGGDLQHDAENIPRFLEQVAVGYDVVSGWRRQRADEFRLRRIPSNCANWLMAQLSGVKIRDLGTTAFKVYRRDLLARMPVYGELHRFIPALAGWYGASVCEIPVQGSNRERGESHHGLRRTLRVFLDLITIRFFLQYLSRPLHFFGTAGLAGIVIGGLIAAWLLVHKLVYQTSLMQGHILLVISAAVLILGGIQLLGLGLLGEMQLRHGREQTSHGPYSVDRVLRTRKQQTIPE